MPHEQLTFGPAPAINVDQADRKLIGERRNVNTQRASLHHQRATGKSSELFSAVTSLLYGCGREGRTLEELHERIAQQRPSTPLSSITQPLIDARLAGVVVKTNRSRLNKTKTRQNRIFIHRAHWQLDDGAEHVNDTPSNRDNLRRLLSNGYPIYGGEVPREYEHWIERNEAMGLDIFCGATVCEARKAIEWQLEYADETTESMEPSRAMLERGLRVLDGRKDTGTRPGSYAGIHVVRCAYARHRGWPLDESGRHPHYAHCEKSHLCNHSDCDGVYIPEDFAEPIWTPEKLSIGSSWRLLCELWEIVGWRDAEPERSNAGHGWRWDELYLPAIVSVCCQTVIRFG